MAKNNPGALPRSKWQLGSRANKKYRMLRAEARRNYRESVEEVDNQDKSFLEFTWEKIAGDKRAKLDKELESTLKAFRAKHKEDRTHERMEGYKPAAYTLLLAEARKIVKKYPDLTRDQLIAKVKEMGRGRAPVIQDKDGLPTWVNRKMRGGKSL